MGDKLLDSTQIINGLAVMLSFFVGYRYALKRGDAKDSTSDEGAAAPSLAGSSVTSASEAPVSDKVRKKPFMRSWEVVQRYRHWHT